MITLTAEEWARFDRKHREDDDSPLQACCANISELRSAILAIAENKGVVTEKMAADLARAWEWCVDGHSFDDVRHPPSKLLRSVIEQAGLVWPKEG